MRDNNGIGGVCAAGIGGLVIDDPHKDREHKDREAADSQLRRAVIDWWESAAPGIRCCCTGWW